MITLSVNLIALFPSTLIQMKINICFLIITLFILTITCASAQDTARHYSNEVTIKGLVAHPFICNMACIRQLKTQTGNNLNIVGAGGDIRKTFRTYKAVTLKTLLDSATIIIDKPKEKGRYYVVVTAIDGYTTLYSWNELFNNSNGDHVFLLYEENDKPIEQDGRFVMVSASDKITGARHVKWVKTIEVAKLP
jgi:DMSO/TMAO reductase YedYZ molybdopterin-dependent catalytic subunit